VRSLVISQQITQELVRNLIPRAAINIAEATDVTTAIIAEVRNSGVAALKEHSAKFDGVIPENFRVPKAALEKALRELDSELRISIETAIERVKKVSEAGLPKEFSVELANGAFVHQRYQPVDSVGLYVPGGKAVYPSSVVMNAVAALVAKVPRIAIASPAQKEFDGLPHPSILATAELLKLLRFMQLGEQVRLRRLLMALVTLALSHAEWSRVRETFTLPQQSGYSDQKLGSTLRRAHLRF